MGYAHAKLTIWITKSYTHEATFSETTDAPCGVYRYVSINVGLVLSSSLYHLKIPHLLVPIGCRYLMIFVFFYTMQRPSCVGTNCPTMNLM